MLRGAVIAATTALSLMSAQAADLGASSLLGCWRDEEGQVPKGAVLVTLPSSEVGLSWGVDPSTGLELAGMVPYSELCFDPDGTVSSTHINHFEGLGSSGPYTFDGRTLSVYDTYDFPDGWLFGSRGAQCKVTIEDDTLTLGGCGDEMRYVRSTGQ